MTKIHIIGAAGSGKSTLAQNLSNQTGAPCFDLDYFAYEGGMGGWQRKAVPYEERLACAREIASRPNWITEGIYDDWVEPLVQKSDFVIYMDVPYFKVAWRVIKRHYLRSKAGDNRYKGILRLLIFLLWILRYYYYPDNNNPSRWRVTRNVLNKKRWLLLYKTEADLDPIWWFIQAFKTKVIVNE